MTWTSLTSKSKVRLVISTLLVAGSLLLSGCGQDNSLLDPTKSTPAIPSNSKTPGATSTTPATSPKGSGTPVPADANKPGSPSSISLDIELPPVLETVESLVFKVKPSVALEQLPVNASWQWDFGDATPVDTKVGRTEPYLTTGHRYARNGDYQIKVSLVDLTTNKALATVTKGFIVSDIVSIKRVNHLQLILKLSGMTEITDAKGLPEPSQVNMRTFNEELFRKQPWTFEWTNEWRSGSPGQWGGDEIKFKGTYNIVRNTETGEQTTEYAVTGKITVSSEGIKLVDYYSTSDFRNPNYKGGTTGWFVETTLELNPIPITKISGGKAPKFQTRIQGYESIWGYLKSAFHHELLPNGKQNDWGPTHAPELPESDLQIVFDSLKNAG